MTTISAMELRQNLSNIIQRCIAGEEFLVIYRSKPIVTITPIKSSSRRRNGDEVGNHLGNLLKDRKRD